MATVQPLKECVIGENDRGKQKICGKKRVAVQTSKV